MVIFGSAVSVQNINMPVDIVGKKKKKRKEVFVFRAFYFLNAERGAFSFVTVV